MSATLSSDPDNYRRRAADMAVHTVPDATYRKWADRAPADVTVDVVEAWHQAEPVHFPNAANGAVARLHVSSGMLLLARQGAILSCYPLANRSRTEQQYVKQQVTDQ